MESRRLETWLGPLARRSPGRGPALVFFAGALANHDLWRDVVAALEDRYRRITIDSRWERIPGRCRWEQADRLPRLARLLPDCLELLDVDVATVVANDTARGLLLLSLATLTQLIGCHIIATDQLLHVGSSADRARREAQARGGEVIMAQTPSTPTEREGLALSDNIEIITRFEHAFRAADQATIDELCDPGLVDHNPAPGEEPTLAGFKQKVAGFKASFPDLEEDLQDIIASGDTVATRWVVTGSQQQELMGIPASGQTIRVEGMNFYRLKDGRVTGIWTQFDGVALMQQLGAIPA